VAIFAEEFCFIH